MKRTTSFLMTVLAMCGVVLAPSSPAEATGACGGLGFLNAGPLSYPVTRDRFAIDEITVRQPVTTSFSFAIVLGLCANGEPSTFDKQLTATGLLSGWCGHTSGVGITGNGFRFAWVDVGGLAVFTGGLVGIAAITDIAQGGCSTGGSYQFHITALALKAHCNSSEGLTPVPIPASLTTPAPGVGIHTGPWHIWTKVCVPSPLLA